MKKFVAIALFAIAPLLAAAAPSQDVISETMSDGLSVRTRSLDARGVLTESTCVSSSQGAQALQHCVSRSTRLNAAQRKDVYSQMQMAQQALTSLALFRAETQSRSQGVSRSMDQVGQGSDQFSSSMKLSAASHSLSESMAAELSKSQRAIGPKND